MMDAQDIRPRRVLVIAYYFPPMGLSGVQRTLKFVKYLPAEGWLPLVHTVANPYWPLQAARALGDDFAWPKQYQRAKPAV